MRKFKHYIRDRFVWFMCNQVIKAGEKSLSPHHFEMLEETIGWILIARGLKPNPLLNKK